MRNVLKTLAVAGLVGASALSFSATDAKAFWGWGPGSGWGGPGWYAPGWYGPAYPVSRYPNVFVRLE